MENDTSKTPYNSIYETLNGKNPKQDGEFVCCIHGNQCHYGRGKPANTTKVADGQYVNLPGPSESKEQKVAENLAAKLRTLAASEEQKEQPEEQLDKVPKKKGTMRSTRDKRKKKKPAMLADNQAYEMLGPTTESSTKTSVLPPSNDASSISTKLGEAHSAYIGVFTAGEAETQVSRRGDFALYHLFETQGCLNNLTSGLPLMLVYFTTTKKHRHYPIRTYGTAEDLQFYVDCGYPNLRRHYSLNQLVKYYKTSGSLQIHPEDTYADSFSWWLE